MFFLAGFGYDLWKSDGTSAGTVLVKSFSSQLGDLTDVNGVLFFIGYDAVNGRELWKSDGTTDGTVLVKDIYTGTSGSDPSSLVNVNGTLFFAARDAAAGNELWRSDGTVAGTVMVKDIYAGTSGFYLSSLVNVNGTVFFIVDDDATGYELWKSDGTSAGTEIVKDIWPGPNSGISDFAFLFSHQGAVYFAANDGVAGEELWRSDGTAEGTFMAGDLTGDSGSSRPFLLKSVGGLLFFTAIQSGVGRELFVLNSLAVSSPRFSNATISGNQFQATLTGASGSAFGIEISTNLTNWTRWTNVVLTNGTFQLIESTTNGNRFYRMVTP